MLQPESAETVVEKFVAFSGSICMSHFRVQASHKFRGKGSELVLHPRSVNTKPKVLITKPKPRIPAPLVPQPRHDPFGTFCRISTNSVFCLKHSQPRVWYVKIGLRRSQP